MFLQPKIQVMHRFATRWRQRELTLLVVFIVIDFPFFFFLDELIHDLWFLVAVGGVPAVCQHAGGRLHHLLHHGSLLHLR